MLIGSQVSKFDSPIRRNPFAGLKPETKSLERKQKLKEDKAIRQLTKLWEKHQLQEIGESWDVNKLYSELEKDLTDIDFGAEDIRRFCALWLSILQNQYGEDSRLETKAGVFLSVLMNCGKDKEYELDVENFPQMRYLGYRNLKNIRINGSVGYNCAESMAGGTIEIFGDCKSICECMTGGKVIIHGKVSDAGILAKGGEIIIYGNAKNIGSNAKRCNITVYGNVEEITPANECTIRIEGDICRMNEYGYEKVSIGNGNLYIKGNVGTVNRSITRFFCEINETVRIDGIVYGWMSFSGKGKAHLSVDNLIFQMNLHIELQRHYTKERLRYTWSSKVDVYCGEVLILRREEYVDFQKVIGQLEAMKKSANESLDKTNQNAGRS